MILRCTPKDQPNEHHDFLNMITAAHFIFNNNTKLNKNNTVQINRKLENAMTGTMHWLLRNNLNYQYYGFYLQWIENKWIHF